MKYKDLIQFESVDEIIKLKKENPEAIVLAHPECKGPVLAIADVVGSTAVLLKYATENPGKKYIVATESQEKVSESKET